MILSIKRSNKNLLIVVYLIIIFFLATMVWYSPIVFKGYPVQTISNDLLLARNFHLTKTLATQNEFNVTISSENIKDNGHVLLVSENLRSVFWAKIFDVFGVLDYNYLILISIILYALVLICFTVLIIRLFGAKIGAIFALFYIFSPLGWGLSRMIGVYEFCLLFWALCLIFYFFGVKREKSKFGPLLFLFSGIFMALSGLSKEVTFVFALALFVFLLFKKLKRQLIYIFIPFVIILLIFWLPPVLKGENRYLNLVGMDAQEDANFSVYMHVFPDPYTYYFEKEQFLEKFKSQDLGWSENLQTKKVLTNFGFEKINLFERIGLGTFILVQHLPRFFSLEEFGGPLITILLIMGLVYLKKKNRFFYQFSISWLLISFLVFSFVILVNRNHLMDFIWLLVVLAVLGLFYLFNILRDRLMLSKKCFVVCGAVIVGLFVYHFILINHVVLGKLYDKDNVPRAMTYAEKINDMNIKNDEVIAVPGNFAGQTELMNYLTDKSFVIFKEPTLKKLLTENKIKDIFKKFKVKYILDYSEDLSDKIVKNGVKNIAPNSLKPDMRITSENKIFFMNLIR